MDLNSVILSKKPDGSWQALHEPSQRFTFGESATEAEEAMRGLLGMNDQGEFEEPITSDRFEGWAQDIAVYLEGPISKQLAEHAGYSRLEAYEQGIAHVRLGGGCEGCPSSMMTLIHGVKAQLQEEFGDDVVTEVVPVTH